MTHRIILDVSRTLVRAEHPVPTGIDRVEMAYAEGLLARCPERLEFAALHPLGRFGRLPTAATADALRLVARRWREGAQHAEAVARAARALFGPRLMGTGLRGTGLSRRRHKGPTTYLNVSHHHLDRPSVVFEAKARYGAGFVCLVHDLIPLEHPEFVRPADPARHERRIETAATLADGVITNSAATAAALRPWLDAVGRQPPVLTAPLGVDPPPACAVVAPDHPTFVLMSTIEPRKNHLLLLHLWRRLVERHGLAAPHLVLIGRRGWENEQVVDMIERCEALRGVVQERAGLPDAEASALLRGARALLLPSFAEGFGLPVAEALAAGTPVLCSDLPALREAGGDVPDYLDPLDGPGWLRAIDDYAAPDSPGRAAQLARLARWRVPRWDAHMDRALAFLDGLAEERAADGDDGLTGPEQPMEQPASTMS